MCPKTPKVKETQQKKPQYMRNPFLDGLALGATSGRSSLRVDLNTAGPAQPSLPAAPSIVTPGVIAPDTRPLPIMGGGRGRTAARRRALEL